MKSFLITLFALGCVASLSATDVDALPGDVSSDLIRLIRKLEKCVPDARENLENLVDLVRDLRTAVEKEDITAVGVIIEKSTVQMEEALRKIDVPELRTGISDILDLNARLLAKIEQGSATMKDVLRMLKKDQIIMMKAVKTCNK